MYSFSYLEPVCCSMSSSNCCFLTYIQVSIYCHHRIFPGIFLGVDHSLLFEMFSSLRLPNSAFDEFSSKPLPISSLLVSFVEYTPLWNSFQFIACFQKFHPIPWLHTGDFQNCTLAIETNLVSRLLHLCPQLLEISSWNLIGTWSTFKLKWPPNLFLLHSFQSQKVPPKIQKSGSYTYISIFFPHLHIPI